MARLPISLFCLFFVALFSLGARDGWKEAHRDGALVDAIIDHAEVYCPSDQAVPCKLLFPVDNSGRGLTYTPPNDEKPEGALTTGASFVDELVRSGDANEKWMYLLDKSSFAIVGSTAGAWIADVIKDGAAGALERVSKQTRKQIIIGALTAVSGYALGYFLTGRLTYPTPESHAALAFVSSSDNWAHIIFPEFAAKRVRRLQALQRGWLVDLVLNSTRIPPSILPKLCGTPNSIIQRLKDGDTGEDAIKLISKYERAQANAEAMLSVSVIAKNFEEALAATKKPTSPKDLVDLSNRARYAAFHAYFDTTAIGDAIVVFEGSRYLSAIDFGGTDSLPNDTWREAKELAIGCFSIDSTRAFAELVSDTAKTDGTTEAQLRAIAGTGLQLRNAMSSTAEFSTPSTTEEVLVYIFWGIAIIVASLFAYGSALGLIWIAKAIRRYTRRRVG
jgi:hypothetical protein